jgi:formate hydrogenlyase transcriptional activator
MAAQPRDQIADAAQRYRALIDVADVMALRQPVPELLRELARRLHEIENFDFIHFALHDDARNVMRIVLYSGSNPDQAPLAKELEMESSIGGWVWLHQQSVILKELATESRFPQMISVLRESGVRSFCMFPLTSGDHKLGALGFGSSEPYHYSEENLQFLGTIAKLVAVVVENAGNEEQLVRERDRSQLLLEVTNAVVSTLDFKQLFAAVGEWLRRVVRHDYTSIVIYDHERNSIRLYALDFPASQGFIYPDVESVATDSPSARALLTRKLQVYSRAELEQMNSPMMKMLMRESILSFCCIPLYTSKTDFGALCLGSFKECAFRDADLTLIERIAGQIAIALENARAYQEISSLKDKLASEKLYLENEIRTEHNFDEFVGDSAVLGRVLHEIETVAPSEASVLILGETGTGKELVARAIHQLSARKNQNFVKLSCAAIPSGLLESELFGHEKGAFTGALSQKVGRLELANGGTLFLDEVGDIPPELQPKLLRVLQEQEFERLGSNRTVRVNVRIIAATNRELEKLVQQREFRSDLYYRLKVFPIYVPPLRERREDIPLLVRYFVQRFARRMNKVIDVIPESAMNVLLAWSWPGNVRELENLIERSMILSKGPVLTVPLAELQIPPVHAGGGLDALLKSAEREQIVRVLRETKGTMSGPAGAAARLGVKRTTLQSKMRKLGISRHDFLN